MTSHAAVTTVTSDIPSLPVSSPLGVAPELRRDPLGLLVRATLEHGPIVRMPIPSIEAYVLGTPQLVEHVLVTNSRNYTKQTRGYAMLRKVMGNGLVTSEGSFWKRQRRIAQPAFHRERLAHFGAVMVKAASEMVDSWREGASFDATHEMMRCTLRIVGETMLSSDVTTEAERVGQALTTVLEHLITRTTHPWSLPEWVPTPANRLFKQALAELDRVVLELIRARRRAPEPGADLLGMFMSTRDPETHEVMNDAQLRDEVMTVFLAGHETTANALSWALSLLGRYPLAERRVVSELESVLEGRAPTMADLPRLPQLANVVKESLRLYPPVWSLGRQVVEDDVVDGLQLPRKALVFFSPFALHRLPRFWRDPEAFDPDRWLEEDVRRPAGAYLPFSLGQRKCIGDMFALTEAQLVLATVLQRVHLELKPGQRFEPEPVITLRPRDGVHVTARLRPRRP